jgi:predicted dehydrogenase
VTNTAPDGPTGVAVGLVGCGRWGSLILRDLVALGCEVHVVARSPASVANAAAGGASSVHPAVAKLSCGTAVLEGIIVATTAGQHHPVVMEVLRIYGSALPIFCEKPLATSVREAEEMAETAHRLFVMDKWRYHPAIRRMALARETGEFGALVGLHARRIQPGNPHPDVSPPWTYLPHDLSIVLEVLGNLPAVTRAVSDHGDETVFAFLGERPWVEIECSTRALWKSREVDAHFERGVLSMIDPLASTLRLQPNDGPARDLPVPGEMPLLAELRAFVGHLRGGPAPRSTAADGVRVVRSIQDVLSLAHAS